MTKVREELGIDQSSMAERMGLSISDYEKLEVGTKMYTKLHDNALIAVLLQAATNEPGAPLSSHLEFFLAPIRKHWFAQARSKEASD